jgi:hypothetical protein
MKIDDLSNSTLAKFQKHDEEGWFVVETPYLDSKSNPIKILFIHEPNDTRIGKWYSITDNGLLSELGLADFIEENFTRILDDHGEYCYKVNSEHLGESILRMAEFISGLSNIILTKKERT